MGWLVDGSVSQRQCCRVGLVEVAGFFLGERGRNARTKAEVEVWGGGSRTEFVTLDALFREFWTAL